MRYWIIVSVLGMLTFLFFSFGMFTSMLDTGQLNAESKGVAIAFIYILPFFTELFVVAVGGMIRLFILLLPYLRGDE